MEKSIWEFILSGFSGIAGIIFIVLLVGFTPLGISIIIIIALVLAVIYLIRNPLIKKTSEGIEMKHNIGGFLSKPSSNKILVDQTICLYADDYQPYDFEFDKDTRLKVKIKANNPVNLYSLDKWHFHREDSWPDYDSTTLGIKRFNGEKVIPQNELRFIVVEGVDDNTDVDIKIIQINR